jgi:hypothetical protein
MSTGSRRYFQYTADDGNLYGYELDESTYETAALGFGPLTQSSPDFRGLQAVGATRPISMRYLNMVGTDTDGREVKRVIYVGDNSSDAWTDPASFTINLATTVGGTTTMRPFAVSSAIGEKRRFIPSFDTGLIDSDVDENAASGPAPE